VLTKNRMIFFAYTITVSCSFAGMAYFVQYCSFDNDRPALDWTALPCFAGPGIDYCTTEKDNIDWSDGRVVMALVSGSPEMSLLVRNRVGSNPTLIIILLFCSPNGSNMLNARGDECL
jgi:hypothetical protein